MVNPTISICIPTYNFGRYIAATLQSILDQGIEDLEIVIVDGASTDNTAEVVRDFQQRYPAIRYCCLARRGGIDRDMAKTVELATGRYCWLFSSDDLMRQGAIKIIRQEVASGHDLYLCKHTNCTLEMQIIGEHPVLQSAVHSDFRLEDQQDRLRYFRLAANTEAFFSFMGGLVIKREAWVSVALNEAFVGSCWAHVARIFQIASVRLSVRYVPQCLLDRRGENDSFADRGVVNRIRIAVEGYGRLADLFFGCQSEEAGHIRRALRNEFRLRHFLYAKMLCWRSPASESREILDALANELHQDLSWRCFLFRVAYKATPAWFYPLLRYVYQSIAPTART